VAEQAVELGRALQDEQILAEAEGRRGLALVVLGRVEEALPVLEEAIRRSDAVGDLHSLYRSLNNLSALHEHRGAFAQAAPCSKRALEVAERMGNPNGIAFMTMRHGQIAFCLGDWRQARAHFERALALSREIGASTVVSECLNSLGGQCLCEGAWEEASRYLRESLSMAERSGDRRSLQWAQVELAKLDLRAGRPEAARARLMPLLERLGREGPDVEYVLPTLAWAHLEVGDVVQARDVGAQGVRRARATTNQLMLLDALRVQAMIATRQGRWAEAERSLEEGLALARSMPYPYAEACLLHVYKQMHAQQGEAARERLQAALVIFRRLGARKDAERLEQDLAALPLP
jgi:tetratricopeptide (TPR) repeat protein